MGPRNDRLPVISWAQAADRSEAEGASPLLRMITLVTETGCDGVWRRIVSGRRQ